MVNAEPTVLRDLLGHKSIAVTYDVYANGTDDLKEKTAERIQEYYTGLTLATASADMEQLFNIIQDLKLHTLEEKDVTRYKREVLRVTYIPRIEQQIRELIIKVSNTQATPEEAQERLNTIYALLSNMENFKEQTQSIKRDLNKCNEDYNYIFHYLQTTQTLVKLMNRANQYEFKQTVGVVQPFAVNY